MELTGRTEPVLPPPRRTLPPPVASDPAILSSIGQSKDMTFDEQVDQLQIEVEKDKERRRMVSGLDTEDLNAMLRAFDKVRMSETDETSRRPLTRPASTACPPVSTRPPLPTTSRARSTSRPGRGIFPGQSQEWSGTALLFSRNGDDEVWERDSAYWIMGGSHSIDHRSYRQ